MSELSDEVERPISSEEINAVKRIIAEREVKRRRVTEVINRVMTQIEQKEKTCEKILMNVKDYGMVRKYLGMDMDVETNADILRTGRMATYCGAGVYVSRGCMKMAGVANLPDGADGCMQVLYDVGDG